jgi:hypothetical protein
LRGDVRRGHDAQYFVAVAGVDGPSLYAGKGFERRRDLFDVAGGIDIGCE